jgi:hypothetical protein
MAPRGGCCSPILAGKCPPLCSTSGGSETLLRIRSFAGSIIDTLESFSGIAWRGSKRAPVRQSRYILFSASRMGITNAARQICWVTVTIQAGAEASPAGFSFKWSILYRRRSRGSLRSTRPRAPFGGWASKSPYLPRFGGAFFCGGTLARFPSSLPKLHFGLACGYQRNQLV